MYALNLIEIHPIPNIDFIANNVCEGEPFFFNDAGMSFIDPIFNDNLKQREEDFQRLLEESVAPVADELDVPTFLRKQNTSSRWSLFK